MKYLFDTDAISFFFDELRQPQHRKIWEKVSQLDENDELLVSVLTIYELEYSFENASAEKKHEIREVLDEFFNKQMFLLAPLKPHFASLFGKLKTALKSKFRSNSKQMKKHNVDIMLASTAIAEQAIIISADGIYIELAELNSNLNHEDWTA